MLKKEHLLCRISSPAVKPRFVAADDPELLKLAGELTAIYALAGNTPLNRQELEELTGGVIRGSSQLKIAAGLNKLLLDRSEFSAPADLDYPAVRRNAFEKSAKLIVSGDFTVGELRECTGNCDLYGDLPILEKLTSFKEISPENLLHRYNLAQAQGLLCYANSLTLTLKDPEPAELRKFFKAVKFFRLLARFTQPAKKVIQVEISGPYALFDATSKYALNLANLLPAIVNLSNWKLSAQLKFKERQLTMNLSDKNALVSHYRELSGYIPPEIRLYHQSFNAKQDEWQIIGDAPFIDAGEQEIIFPDLSFESRESGRIFHVELFHRWHAGQLARRIALLARNPDLPLLLGIDRALVRDEAAFDALFADAPQVKEMCWLFRDFPGVSTTVNALKKAEKRLHRAE